jgi:hypothetical protein
MNIFFPSDGTQPVVVRNDTGAPAVIDFSGVVVPYNMVLFALDDTVTTPTMIHIRCDGTNAEDPDSIATDATATYANHDKGIVLQIGAGVTQAVRFSTVNPAKNLKVFVNVASKNLIASFCNVDR